MTGRAGLHLLQKGAPALACSDALFEPVRFLASCASSMLGRARGCAPAQQHQPQSHGSMLRLLGGRMPCPATISDKYMSRWSAVHALSSSRLPRVHWCGRLNGHRCMASRTEGGSQGQQQQQLQLQQHELTAQQQQQQSVQPGGPVGPAADSNRSRQQAPKPRQRQGTQQQSPQPRSRQVTQQQQPPQQNQPWLQPRQPEGADTHEAPYLPVAPASQPPSVAGHREVNSQVQSQGQQAPWDLPHVQPQQQPQGAAPWPPQHYQQPGQQQQQQQQQAPVPHQQPQAPPPQQQQQQQQWQQQQEGVRQVPYHPQASGTSPLPQGQWAPPAQSAAGAAGARVVARSSAQRDRVSSSSLRPSSPASGNTAAAAAAATAAAAAATVWPTTPPAASASASAAAAPTADPPHEQSANVFETGSSGRSWARPAAMSPQEQAARHTFRYDRRTEQLSPEEQQQVLLEKLAEAWGEVPPHLPQGQSYTDCVCPKCGNGRSGSKSFGVYVDMPNCILWQCFRGNCGFKGGVNLLGGRLADIPATDEDIHRVLSPRQPGQQQQAGAAARQQYQQASGTAWDRRLEESSYSPPQPLDTSCLEPWPLPPSVANWFASRGIDTVTLQQAGVTWARRYSYDDKAVVDVAAFPSTREGVVVNVKLREVNRKRFSQLAGGERVFYGYDEAKGSDTVIIVEGEMDKLSLNAVGYWNVVSVPSGTASARLPDKPLPSPQLDRQFRYVYNCWDLLENAKKVILATDNDAPGVALAEELARRIGKEKCWSVAWPSRRQDHPQLSPAAPATDDGGSEPAEQAEAAGDAWLTSAAADMPAAHVVGADPEWFRKDANEVLVKDGPQALRAFIEAAQPVPVQGLYTFQDFWKPLLDMYNAGFRSASGMSTGWASLDDFYRVVPGELTVVTGVPNSGKSEWLDALAVNLMKEHGWSIAYCSLENPPDRHAIKLMEKFVGKPFESQGYAEGVPRMDEREMTEALAAVDQNFHLIRPVGDEMPSIEHVLQKAELAVLRYGIRGLVIDPYNELAQRYSGSIKETDQVSQMLSRIKRFAQQRQCHVWLVAHPRALQDYSGGAPTLYDISGSAHFVNKADAAVVVHRPNNAMALARRGGAAADTPPGTADPVQVLVRKMRNKAAGKIGDVWLAYDRVTGRYEAVQVSE